MPEARTGKRSPVSAAVLALCGAVLAVEAAAIVSVFWSRASFGHRFDPVVFSEFETVRSTESVNDTLGLKRAEQARREALRPVRDGVTLAMERAGRERAHARLKDQETSAIRGEAEKEAALAIERGEALLRSGLRQQALDAFEAVLRRVPGYLPALRKLASLYEEQGKGAQARFLWEKAAAAVGNDPAASAEIQANLKRLQGAEDALRRPGDRPHVVAPLLRPAVALPSGASLPRLKVSGVTRADLPLEDLYDLRFRLEFSLDSEGYLGPIDVADVRLEVHFYDQARTPDGGVRPVRVVAPGLPFQLQPRREWIAGERQTLSLNYSVPRGYFRGKAMRYGNGYSFCGIVVRLFYRGELQDRYHDPAALAAEAGQG
jgi:hypothetical protein